MKEKEVSEKELNRTLYQLDLRYAKARDERNKKRREEEKKKQAEGRALMLTWAKAQLREQEKVSIRSSVGTRKVGTPKTEQYPDTGESGTPKTKKYPDTGGV